jgi:SAM-dependent methyltransferase
MMENAPTTMPQIVRQIERTLRRGARRAVGVAADGLERVEGAVAGTGDPEAIPLVLAPSLHQTAVDSYWGEHTVHSTPFRSARASLAYLRRRSRDYPLFEQLMELYGNHEHDTVVDYGCGPGNDLVGFLVNGRARRVIGVDISRKALELARRRLALHGIDGSRATLVQMGDGDPQIPLETSSIDYLYCEGVLHHTSDPVGALREFHRIVTPGAKVAIMVYNRDSLYYHLYTAYQRRVLEGAFAGLSIDEAFRRNTDGEECPIARAYVPDAFVAECEQAGFDARFVGGYFADLELRLFRTLGQQAITDERLPAEHRGFLDELEVGEDGFPRYRGQLAGIGGVYHLVKGVPA